MTAPASPLADFYPTTFKQDLNLTLTLTLTLPLTLADFYPATFKQDLNGAHAAWKAVPLLPFIEQA